MWFLLGLVLIILSLCGIMFSFLHMNVEAPSTSDGYQWLWYPSLWLGAAGIATIVIRAAIVIIRMIAGMD